MALLRLVCASTLLVSAVQGFSTTTPRRPLLSAAVTRTRTSYAFARSTGCHTKSHRLHDQQLLFAKKDTETDTDTAVAIERPDPSVLLSAQGDDTQRLGFVGICASIAFGTVIMIQLLNSIESTLPDGWFAAWRDYTWPVPLGLIFTAAGVTHFVFAASYTAFVPPPGTWGGLWQVPAPWADQLKLTYEEYHCYWTGVAEILGGLGLILSGLHLIPLNVQVPALCIGLLTAAVTPANIYMATHDIQPPNFPPVPYPSGHVVRGVMQCVLLGIFYKLAFQ